MRVEAKGWGHWSTNERVAAVILISVLAIFVVLFGLILYEPPTGPGFCGAFGPQPCPQMVILNITSHTLNSPTNVTLKIINSGSVAVTITSYEVSNSNGQVYTNPNWSGPTLAPNAITPINILIDGKAFTFQSGYAYNVMVVTRNYHFDFTIQA
jgi:hypothetical protein